MTKEDKGGREERLDKDLASVVQKVDSAIHQAPVAQMMDSAISRINTTKTNWVIQ